MNNAGTLATFDVQDKGHINVREKRSGNQEGTKERQWQRSIHKTQGEDKLNKNKKHYTHKIIR